MKKLLPLLLCLAMICTAFIGCDSGVDGESSSTASEAPATSNTNSSEEEATSDQGKDLPAMWDNATYKEDVTLGEGAKTVTVKVEAEGHSINVTVKTDAATLGEALLALNLIAGEEGAYGLYVKTVNGILADYDVDGTYWGFYQNGEYMMTGVDATNISGGESFELVRTK